MITITIEDKGPGIPAAEATSIFEPFTRLSDRLVDGVTGTGIGLTISRELARRQNGDLVLSSSEIGATFKLTLHAPSNTGDPLLTKGSTIKGAKDESLNS